MGWASRKTAHNTHRGQRTMTIHDMLATTSSEIRALEMQVEALKQRVETADKDNAKLRELNAEIMADRMKAEADLKHYKNVFVSSVCIEAAEICGEMFTQVQEKAKIRAEQAIRHMVEEHKEEEQVERNVKVEEPVEQLKAFLEEKPCVEGQEDMIASPDQYMSLKHLREFYSKTMGFIPYDWKERPTYYRVNGQWYKPNEIDPIKVEEYKPNGDPKAGVARAALAIFGM